MINGFVHIIESPSAEDLLDGRTEGQALGQALRLANIDLCYNLAANKRTLGAALNERLQAARQGCNKLPIIHLSAHGNAQGIGLTSGEFVTWDELGRALSPWNNVFDHGLLVCISSCESFYGIQMAMTDDADRPFLALVSHTGKPTWSDACVGYITFYARLFKGAPLETAVEAMKWATGDIGFAHMLGSQVKADWMSRAERNLQQGMAPLGTPLGGLFAASGNH